MGPGVGHGAQAKVPGRSRASGLLKVQGEDSWLFTGNLNTDTSKNSKPGFPALFFEKIRG